MSKPVSRGLRIAPSLTLPSTGAPNLSEKVYLGLAMALFRWSGLQGMLGAQSPRLVGVGGSQILERLGPVADSSMQSLSLRGWTLTLVSFGLGAGAEQGVGSCPLAV